MKQALEDIVQLLDNNKIEPSFTDVADLLWLYSVMGGEAKTSKVNGDEESKEQEKSQSEKFDKTRDREQEKSTQDTETDNRTPLHSKSDNQNGTSKGDYFKAPTRKQFNQFNQFATVLKILKQFSNSSSNYEFNENETIEYIANTNIWNIQTTPQKELKYTLFIIIEKSISMRIWEEITREFVSALSRFSFFKDVKVVYLKEQDEEYQLYRDKYCKKKTSSKLFNSQTQRTLTILLSDCISKGWQDKRGYNFLDEVTAVTPFLIINMLPQRVWNRTMVNESWRVKFTHREGWKNEDLVSDVDYEEDIDDILEEHIRVPMTTLEKIPLKHWSNLIAGYKNNWVHGSLFEAEVFKIDIPKASNTKPSSNNISPEQQVKNFYAYASPLAHELAIYFSAVDGLSMEIMKMIQKTSLPKTNHTHLAEVFLSGLLKRGKSKTKFNDDTYRFQDGVKEVLAKRLTPQLKENIKESNSEFIKEHLGKLRDFQAVIESEDSVDGVSIEGSGEGFASVESRDFELGKEKSINNVLRCDEVIDYTVKIEYQGMYTNGFILKLDTIPNSFFVITVKHIFANDLLSTEVNLHIKEVLINYKSEVIVPKQIIFLEADMIVFVFDSSASNTIDSLNIIPLASSSSHKFKESIFAGYSRGNNLICQKCIYSDKLKGENLYTVKTKQYNKNNILIASGSGLFIKENGKYVVVGMIVSYREDLFTFNYMALAPYIEEIKVKLLQNKYLTSIPPLNPKFIGREAELKEIEKNLSSDNVVCVVNGIGGVGKSELSYKYLHNNKDKYNKIAFIEFTGESRSLEETFYFKFQDTFQLTEKDTLDTIIKKLQGLKKPNLMVLDNLQTNEDFNKVKVLNTNFDLLITTRAKLDSPNILNLESLNNGDMRELFLSIYPTDENIDSILKYLDNHPLFITLTAYSLNEEYIDLDELRADIASGKVTDIDSKDNKTFQEHLHDTFDRQFKNEQNSELKEILQILALFPAIEIEFEMLKQIIADKKLKVKLQKLVARGWLSKKDNSYKLHQIIKTFILTSYPAEYEDITFVLENIGNYIDPSDSVLIASQLSDYIPIIDSLLELFKDKGDEPIAKILDSNTYIYYSLGEYNSSLKMQKESLEIREVLYDKKSVLIAKNYDLLGVIYDAKGEYSKAEPLYKKALKIYEEVLGISHPNTATSYNNLASLYESIGNYAKAEPLYEKVLKIREEVLGENHLDTATSYNSLAFLYELKGDYNKVELLYLKALKIREKLLGENHLDTAKSYNNLALLYKAKGDYDKAESLFEKALKIREELLGENHPDTATSYNNLAFFYKDRKQCQKAKVYLEKVIDSVEKLEYKYISLIDLRRALKEVNRNIKRTNFKNIGRFCINVENNSEVEEKIDDIKEEKKDRDNLSIFFDEFLDTYQKTINRKEDFEIYAQNCVLKAWNIIEWFAIKIIQLNGEYVSTDEKNIFTVIKQVMRKDNPYIDEKNRKYIEKKLFRIKEIRNQVAHHSVGYTIGKRKLDEIKEDIIYLVNFLENYEPNFQSSLEVEQESINKDIQNPKELFYKDLDNVEKFLKLLLTVFKDNVLQEKINSLNGIAGDLRYRVSAYDFKFIDFILAEVNQVEYPNIFIEESNKLNKVFLSENNPKDIFIEEIKKTSDFFISLYKNLSYEQDYLNGVSRSQLKYKEGNFDKEINEIVSSSRELINFIKSMNIEELANFIYSFHTDEINSSVRRDLKKIIRFFWFNGAFIQKREETINKKLRDYSKIIKILKEEKILKSMFVATKQKRKDTVYSFSEKYLNLRKIMEENGTCNEFEEIVKIVEEKIDSSISELNKSKEKNGDIKDNKKVIESAQSANVLLKNTITYLQDNKKHIIQDIVNSLKKAEKKYIVDLVENEKSFIKSIDNHFLWMIDYMKELNNEKVNLDTLTIIESLYPVYCDFYREFAIYIEKNKIPDNIKKILKKFSNEIANKYKCN